MKTVVLWWKKQKKAGCFVILLLLSACQSLESPVANDGLEEDARQKQILQHESELRARTRFEVAGGLGIWTDTESISARLNWTQEPERFALSLVGPLGMGSILLLDQAGEVTLTRGHSVVARGSVTDTVLQQGLSLAAPVPLGQLAFWIKGLPGNAKSIVRDEEGRLSSLQFSDTLGTTWQARFRRYTLWDGAQVPALITASGGPYSVRLLLKNWHYDATIAVPDTPESNNRLPIPGR